MKKYHLYLWFIALVGLMTSCSQDETDALQTATESNRVTLTASLPEDTGTAHGSHRRLHTPLHPRSMDARRKPCVEIPGRKSETDRRQRSIRFQDR